MSELDNPFADPDTQNLFNDASVQQATRSNAHAALNDFNPFADQHTQFGYGSQAHTNVLGAVPNPQAASKPAVLEPSMPYGAAGTARPTGSFSWEAEELRKRQEELERKAEELSRREQEMNEKLISTGLVERKKNFPPFPARCPIQPCFFQDITVDIPLEFQRIVKNAYYLWIGYSALLLLNVLGSLTYLIGSMSNSIDNSSGSTFGLSIFYCLLFMPCSFVCWFRPIYNAFKDDSSANFFLFFFIFFFQLCVCILQFLGMEGWGTVGIINSSKMLASGKPGAIVAGVIMILIGALFGVAAALDGIVLVRVHRIFRSSGASFAKAQEEFARGVMSNKTVQQTAGNMAASAARSNIQ